MNENIMDWGLEIIIIVGAIFVGWLFKRFIHGFLRKLTKKTSFKTDDILLNAVESQIVVWISLAAIYYVVSTTKILQPYSEYLVKGVVFTLILSITFAISKFFIGMIDDWSEQQGRAIPSTKIFVNLVRALIFVIGVLVALDFIGVSITPMLTALGVGGLAISLALKDTLSDVFAGLHILLSKKVQPDDFIELESGQMGYIKNITWRNTTILERTNNIFIVPNTLLSAAIVKNYSTIDKTFAAKLEIGVSYESNLEYVEKVTLEVAQDVAKRMSEHAKNFEPFLRYYEFGDSSINYKVFFQVNQYGDQFAIIHEFIKQILKRYKKEGINIPFPIRTLYHMNNIEMENK